MYFFCFSVLALPAFTLAAHLSSRQAECPPIWSTIAADLQEQFSGCNDDARAAIRMPFHDCFNNGCDGSLVLAGECSRGENAGLEDFCTSTGAKANQYGVGAADYIQFAGAVAIAVCPLGPRVRALVGRPDSSTPATEGQIPDTSDSVDHILAAFEAKGFSATDVVALVGSHTAAKQFFDDPSKAGQSLDSTPNAWDITFYAQTLTGTAPHSFSSDRRMAVDPRTAPAWINFSINQPGWNTAFIDAWDRFAVLGNDVGSLVDCSDFIP